MRPLPLALLCLLLAAAPVAAQDGEPAEAETGGADESGNAADGDREVGISEENWRRHMELGDVELQRNNFPVTDYGAQAELQKMGRLPEASQRHLRDLLRDQIVQGGAWTPAETAQDHPYSPSAAARGDGELRRQETEAWDELVAKYLAREQELDADARGAGAPGGAPPAGTAQEGSGDGGAGQQAASAPADALSLSALSGQPGGQAGAGREAAATTPGGAPPSGSGNEQGSAQSALDFLTAGGEASASNASAQAEGQQASQQGSQQSSSTGASQPASQQTSSASASQQVSQQSPASSSPSQPQQQAQASASNASAQSSEQATEESENPDQSQDVEYLEQEGVLDLRELENARGVTPDEGESDEEEE